ncbi:MULTISPECIES: DUF6416 domain-containing protein [unclassified Streptomyces]|uniref:DUF6416 domain-containing protein n=1 Tax=unclassified Streptomyces TaxID=2593676 RepID=UPI002E76637F|nr:MULTISPECIES: DUF6416 domain-containing protein [unclassified Streptomyces]MEE1766510.1 DUF6416 domain-containing protein [Streptomyces sp. SP18BB07]MEE1837130.1 DUF6416 domain-containing protein [Streptomyces sp. SP17KL33]
MYPVEDDGRWAQHSGWTGATGSAGVRVPVAQPWPGDPLHEQGAWQQRAALPVVWWEAPQGRTGATYAARPSVAAVFLVGRLGR